MNSSICASNVDVNFGVGADCWRKYLKGPSGSVSKGSGVVGEEDEDTEKGKGEEG